MAKKKHDIENKSPATHTPKPWRPFAAACLAARWPSRKQRSCHIRNVLAARRAEANRHA